MSESRFTELLGQGLYLFTQTRPLIPTYVHLILSALFPIYVGAHASLHRPVSAGKPPKKKRHEDAERAVSNLEEETQPSQGFDMLDVFLYPILAAALLTGLYFLIQYLDDPAIISKILNAYLSVFGLLGVASFLSDGAETIFSFVFPAKYLHTGRVWLVDSSRRLVLPQKMNDQDLHPGVRLSPLPSFLSSLPIPESFLWRVRDLVYKPAFFVHIEALQKVTELSPTVTNITAVLASVAVVAYFNLVDRPWWLTNLLGFSFTYSGFQLMTPTSFTIGTLLLTLLFFYDIYMVFFTPMMIEVASKLDIPAKLVFPRPADASGRPQLAMLGLGDVVVPGIVIALALRFDLYMFYIRKQKRTTDTRPAQTAEGRKVDKPAARFKKATYARVTGTWGDRFWLGKRSSEIVGGSFPKVYFHAGMIGYILGLVTTLVVMQIYQHGQPALLYLVPCVLGAIWSTALLRGEVGIIYKYTEDVDVARNIGLDSAAILAGDKEQGGDKLVLKERDKLEDGENKDAAGPAGSSPTPEQPTGESTEPVDASKSDGTSGSTSAPTLANSLSEKSKVETQNKLLVFTITLPPAAPKREKGSRGKSTDSAEEERFKESFRGLETAEEHVHGEPAGKRRKLA